MKIISLSMVLLFMLAATGTAGYSAPLREGVILASAGKAEVRQPASGKVVIRGKGGKVTDVEQGPADKRKGKTGRKDGKNK